MLVNTFGKLISENPMLSCCRHMNKTPILNDSNEGYFIVEFKLHLQYFRKSSFNAGSCFNFLTVLADL
jgi:hypothetical protein